MLLLVCLALLFVVVAVGIFGIYCFWGVGGAFCEDIWWSAFVVPGRRPTCTLDCNHRACQTTLASRRSRTGSRKKISTRVSLTCHHYVPILSSSVLLVCVGEDLRRSCPIHGSQTATKCKKSNVGRTTTQCRFGLR
jgi:hypothetical protein